VPANWNGTPIGILDHARARSSPGGVQEAALGTDRRSLYRRSSPRSFNPICARDTIALARKARDSHGRRQRCRMFVETFPIIDGVIARRRIRSGDEHSLDGWFV
jgi:hypothetical protein